MEKFFQKETQTEPVKDVISDDEQEQEQQSSITISPSPHPFTLICLSSSISMPFVYRNIPSKEALFFLFF
jgi:hypothetical protein